MGNQSQIAIYKALVSKPELWNEVSGESARLVYTVQYSTELGRDTRTKISDRTESSSSSVPPPGPSGLNADLQEVVGSGI